jgi:hypothetical protein
MKMVIVSLINTKLHLISGVMIGVGAAMICKEVCKRKRSSGNDVSETNEQSQ